MKILLGNLVIYKFDLPIFENIWDKNYTVSLLFSHPSCYSAKS